MASRGGHGQTESSGGRRVNDASKDVGTGKNVNRETMQSEFERWITGFSGKAVYEEGLKLFRSGAVLELRRPNAKVLQGMVANERGRFERSQITFAKESAVPGCTCGRPRGWCAHSVAALLAFFEQEPDAPGGWEGWWPTGAATAGTLKQDGAAPAGPVSAGRVAAPPDSTTAMFQASSVRHLFPNAEQPPHLVLRILRDGAAADRRWSSALFEVTLHVKGRAYAAANIRHLVESGSAAGGMVWNDFSPRERQIMRYLSANANPVKGGLEMGVLELAEFLHGLAGFPELYLGEQRLELHSERVQPVLEVARTATGTVRVQPLLEAPGAGRLPPARTDILAGRTGWWLGLDDHFWWLPAQMEGACFRFILRGEAEELPAAEFEQLLLAGSRDACGVLIREAAPDAGTAALAVHPAGCDPVAFFDWRDGAVTARLEFEYEGIRFGPGASGAGQLRQLVTRDPAAETAAGDRLRRAGFVSRATAEGEEWQLEEVEQIWDFCRSGFEALPGHWRRFMTPEFLRVRATAGVAEVQIKPAGESISWFELDCRITTVNGQEVPWDSILEAIRGNRSTLLLPDGTLTHVPESVRDLLTLLDADTQSHEDTRWRFPLFAGPAVQALLGETATGFQTNWLAMCRRLRGRVEPTDDLLTGELNRILRGYQKEGVAWLRLLQECGFHGILADEMGLGKTLQALALLAWRKRSGAAKAPSLVVCPTSLLENWRNEAARFTPELATLIIHGSQRSEAFAELPKQDLVITSYALLRRDIKHYREQPFDTVILDEAQHIKNFQTANAQTCKELVAPHRLILTGTPIENALLEVWSLFDFLMPGFLSNHQAFSQRYESQDGEAGSLARRQLAARVRPFILRRRKADVCQELPPKIEQVLYCEMEGAQSRLYHSFLAAGRELVHQAKTEGWRNKRFQVLALLTRLRQVCCHPQLLPGELLAGAGSQPPPSAKTELMQEILMESIDSGHRVILFSQFTSLLKLLTPWLDKNNIPYEYLDGATKERQARVDRFNRDTTIPLFLLSLKAGGTGLNLTGADTVVHYDQWWNPMVEDQATDRAHRIGQLRQVTSVKLVVRGSIEEKILQLQERKRGLIQEVMGGVPSHTGELSDDDLDFLFT